MRVALNLVATAWALFGAQPGAWAHAEPEEFSLRRPQRQSSERPREDLSVEDASEALDLSGAKAPEDVFSVRVTWRSVARIPYPAPPGLVLPELTKPGSLRLFSPGTPLNRRSPPG